MVEFLLLALCTVRYGKNSPLFLSSLDCPPPLSPPCLPVATFRGVDGVVNPSSVRATVGPPSIFVRTMVQGTELRPNGRRQGSRKQEEACRVTFLQFGPDFPLRSAVVAPLYSAGERSIPAVLFLHLFSNRYPAWPFAPEERVSSSFSSESEEKKQGRTADRKNGEEVHRSFSHEECRLQHNLLVLLLCKDVQIRTDTEFSNKYSRRRRLSSTFLNWNKLFPLAPVFRQPIVACRLPASGPGRSVPIWRRITLIPPAAFSEKGKREKEKREERAQLLLFNGDLRRRWEEVGRGRKGAGRKKQARKGGSGR